MGPLIGLVLLCLALALTTDTFLTVRNILNVLDQVTVLGIMAIGMTLVILIGGIDLSVGSVLALASMVMGYVAYPDYLNLGVPAGIAAALVVAALCGLVSGLLVTVTKLPPFIATLAMMSVARGLANMITDGSQIVGFPDWFTNLSIVRHFGFLSVTVGLMIVLAIVFAIFLNYRATGRSLYAIGGTAIGVLIIGVLRNGLNLLGVSPFIQQVVIGVVIALAVATDTWRRRRQ
ncbi:MULTISPECIES: ABC transporter permease [unclassified Mesorhizobium]|uniref:ABC transporter permease n=1 Tax=unclassified Mesorhizobium TaxID=325217 RepID=UPI001FE124A1|nr:MULTISPECIES: ABC transporter permease [unclassified Mesorhizobium]